MSKDKHQENLNVVRLGDGKNPIIMLHGWGVSHKTLYPLGELLSLDTDVHLVDLPGFGASSQPEGVWGSYEYATRMIRYMDDNGIEAADIIGHSFGGRVAIMMASRYPERVGKAVLIASAGIIPKRSFRKNCRISAIKAMRALVKGTDAVFKTSLFRNRFVPRYASRDYLAAGDMKDILVKTVNEDLSEEAVSVKAPTLMLWGDKDLETPLSCGQRLNDPIVASTLVTLQGKDHNPFDGAGAHLCAHHIIPFLGEERR